MKTAKNILVVAMILAFSLNLNAQKYKGYQQWFFGAHIGYNAFWGDITDNGNHIIPGGPFQKSFYQDRNMMYGAWFGKEFSKIMFFRTQFINGYLVGASNFDKKRFVSTNREFNIVLALDLVDFMEWDNKSPWDLYLFGGVGVLSFQSKLTSMNSGEIIRYAPFDSIKYAANHRMISPVFPFGVGLNYTIENRLRFTIETTIRSVSSDWLDSEVSKKRALEGYTYTSFGVTYVFNMPKKGSMGGGGNGNFEAMSDNSGKNYRKKRNNGSVSSNPFKNQVPRRNTAKIKGNPRGKTFKTPK